MRKPYRHHELSDEHFCQCGRAIKKNVVARMPKGTPLRCYHCGYKRRMMARGINPTSLS